MELIGRVSGESALRGEVSLPRYIKESSIVEAEDEFNFPNRGDSCSVYIATKSNAMYRWDEIESKYYCIGRDYTEIESILGGNA